MCLSKLTNTNRPNETDSVTDWPYNISLKTMTEMYMYQPHLKPTCRSTAWCLPYGKSPCRLIEKCLPYWKDWVKYQMGLETSNAWKLQVISVIGLWAPPCKNIQFILPLFPLPGHWHVDAHACVTDNLWVSSDIGIFLRQADTLVSKLPWCEAFRCYNN